MAIILKWFMLPSVSLCSADVNARPLPPFRKAIPARE
jgi:hypothetical protein